MGRRLFANAILGLGLVAAAAGCSACDSGYKPGELGNGGFYFSCSDAVSCSRYSNDAAKFPQAVSLGSTFQVRFVPKSSDTLITFDEKLPDRGITIKAVGEYLSRGASGLAAIKTGYATVTSRDASGRLVDFVTLRVAKPDALVIYAADDVTDAPKRVESVSIGKAESRTYRAFAQEKKAVLAGSLAVEWTSSAPSILEIDSTSEGKVTVIGRAAGTANLVAVGGTFKQEIQVEVKP